MSVRKTILAFAALASLGTAALAPTDASAFGFRGHVGGVHFGGHFGGFHGFSHFGHWGRFSHWGHFYHWGFNHYAWGHHYCTYWCGPHYRWWGWRWRYRGIGVASTGPSYVSSGGSAPSYSSSAPSGGCLTKRELPDGTALFKDLCTGEQAESPQQQGGPAGR